MTTTTKTAKRSEYGLSIYDGENVRYRGNGFKTIKDAVEQTKTWTNSTHAVITRDSDGAEVKRVDLTGQRKKKATTYASKLRVSQLNPLAIERAAFWHEESIGKRIEGTQEVAKVLPSVEFGGPIAASMVNAYNNHRDLLLLVKKFANVLGYGRIEALTVEGQEKLAAEVKAALAAAGVR